MKILSIVSAGYEAGGAETTLAACHRAFQALGHDSRVVSSDLRPDLPHFSTYEFEAIPATGFMRKLSRSIFNTSAYALTRKILAEFNPDVVMLHTMGQVTPAVPFLLRNYPAIQCVHGPEAFVRSLLPWYLDASSFKNRDYDLTKLSMSGRAWYYAYRYPYRSFYRRALRNVDRFVVFSSYARQLLENEGFDARKISYVPMGVQSMSCSSDLPTKADEPLITYAGRLERYKGIGDLIAAMPSVLTECPRARLVIAGDGSYARHARAQVSRLAVEHAVTFVGHVSQAQLTDLHARSVVAVVPSTWPETFGKVGVEAMGVGTPVVACDVGGIRDWLEDDVNGILVPPSQPERLAAAITRVLCDPKLRARLSSNAREGVARFSVEECASNLLGVVAQVLAEVGSDASHFRPAVDSAQPS